MPEEDRPAFLEGLGLHDSGLDRVIRAGYGLLDLVTYFTCGPKEARAWTIIKGTRAPQAAARDPRATSSAASSPARRSRTTITSPCRGEAGAKEAGKMRVEGKEYVVRDGDVLLFRFNV